MVRVLVTDGESRAALAAVRALGRAGHTVYVSAPRLPSLASVSRFAAGSAVVPPTPLLAEQPGQVVGRLRELANAWDADVVLPVTDAAMSAVLRCGGSWERVRGSFCCWIAVVASPPSPTAGCAKSPPQAG